MHPSLQGEWDGVWGTVTPTLMTDLGGAPGCLPPSSNSSTLLCTHPPSRSLGPGSPLHPPALQGPGFRSTLHPPALRSPGSRSTPLPTLCTLMTDLSGVSEHRYEPGIREVGGDAACCRGDVHVVGGAIHKGEGGVGGVPGG